LIHDVCLQDLPVTFVLDRAGLVGDDGPTHHGVLDLAYLRTMPGMIVAAPKDGEEFREMLSWAVDYPAPTAIRIPRGPVPEPIPPARKPVPIRPGRAELLRDGNDVALLAIGSMVAPAVQAADELSAKGFSCAVVNARFVKPLDEVLLSDIARRVRHVFTIEEHVRHGGFGSAVLELLSTHGVATPVTLMALPDAFIEHGDADELLDEAGLSAPRMVQSVLAALAPASQKDDEADIPDPTIVRAEMEAIAQRPLSPELKGWVQRYASVGDRDPFLWNWCLKGVELTCLPCVDPQLRDLNNDTKVIGVMFDVLLDDVADHAKDTTFLEKLLAIPSDGARLELDSLSPEQRRYAEFAAAVWQAIVDRARSYPRYAEFQELLLFDYLQLLNAMRSSSLINLAPHALNLAEHDLYLPHNMHMMVSGTLDLMCSPNLDRDELGRVRSLLWRPQCMGRVGNLITTWERELTERDFSSGVFAQAAEEGYVTPEELLNGDRGELKRRICEHGCEEFFLARWRQYRQRIRSLAGQIRSFDVTEFLHGLERLLQIHLGSRGLK
jgi:transketolase C-terminal domain/subunit